MTICQGTVISPAMSTPLSCSKLTEKPPEVPHSGSEGSPSGAIKELLLSLTTTPVTVPVNIEDINNQQPHSSLLGCPPQYVPSAAIPVPFNSPAHASSSATNMGLIEADIVLVSRRTHCDFHELEPIFDHCETTTNSPVAITSHKQEDMQHDFEPGGHGLESTV
jgi:hypothetical protein